MLKHLLLGFALLVVVQPVLAQQRPANAVAQDGSDSPPLAHEFGPQPAIDDGFNFDVGAGRRYAEAGPPGSAAPDDLGAWRITCDTTVTKPQDPIVNPGQIAGAHIHEFFGNTDSTPFDATYQSLRTTGGSSCGFDGWRSLYWLPAMLDGPGDNAKVIHGEKVSVYYKRWPDTAPQCTPGNIRYAGRCVFIPNALRNISGYDMITGTAPTGSTDFKCITFYSGNSGGLSSEFVKDMQLALSQCPAAPAGATGVKQVLDLKADMAACWDGKNLDSANHRSHTADFIREDSIGLICPKTHPYVMPTYTAQVTYVIDATANRSGTWTPGMQTWHLSSDRMPGKPIMRPGSTFHFDLFDAGNERLKKIINENCINKLLNCSANVLGDGTALVVQMPVDPTAPPKSPRPKMARETSHAILHGPH